MLVRNIIWKKEDNERMKGNDRKQMSATHDHKWVRVTYSSNNSSHWKSQDSTKIVSVSGISNCISESGQNRVMCWVMTSKKTSNTSDVWRTGNKNRFLRENPFTSHVALAEVNSVKVKVRELHWLQSKKLMHFHLSARTMFIHFDETTSWFYPWDKHLGFIITTRHDEDIWRNMYSTSRLINSSKRMKSSLDAENPLQSLYKLIIISCVDP